MSGTIRGVSTGPLEVLNSHDLQVLGSATNLQITISWSGGLDLDIYLYDADGDDVTVKYTGWMTSDTKQTDYDDAGEYDVKLTVSDGVDTVTEDVHVTVLNRNRPPVITKLK